MIFLEIVFTATRYGKNIGNRKLLQRHWRARVEEMLNHSSPIKMAISTLQDPAM